MQFEFLVLLTVFLSMAVFFRWFVIKENRELAATNRMCDSSEIFMEWRMRNPGVYIGLSEDGQKIVQAHITAWDDFYRTHTYVKLNSEHREWLVSLLSELPPKSPHEMPQKKSPTNKSGFLALR